MESARESAAGGRLKQSIIGQTFGRLLVTEREKGSPKCMCLCTCGEKKAVAISSLKNGNTKSCGCYRREYTRGAFKTHGKSGTPEHGIWKAMRRRCYNPNVPEFKNYGARGISMSDAWKADFSRFLSDMGPRPGNEFSIDRIDVNGNYCAGNCRWATAKQQANNTQGKTAMREVVILREELDNLVDILCDGQDEDAQIEIRESIYSKISNWRTE